MTRNLWFAAAFAALTLSGVAVCPTAAAASAQDAQPPAAATPARLAMAAKMGGLTAFIRALAVPEPVRTQSDLEGTYVASDVRPDGSRYRTFVQITTYGDSFLVVTMVADTSGEERQPMLASIGIGVLNGGVLAVCDYSPDTARVVAYRIEEGGRRLVARWTFIDGDGTVSEETLTKLPRKLDPSKELSSIRRR
ncbi:MAG TPA: hypothetical protein VKB50_23170 [Vicinamibacterales bacterium]|nr:hypothetical protein [Vicinamibacterales bacterium]